MRCPENGDNGSDDNQDENGGHMYVWLHRFTPYHTFMSLSILADHTFKLNGSAGQS